MRIGETTTEMETRAQRVASIGKALPQAARTAPPPELGPQPAHAPPVELKKIESVTRQIDSFLRSINRSLQFQVDQGTGEMIVTLRDSETGEVIRQVPGEDALRIAQRIEESLSAMLDEKA
jgi:flagellar protein FlaG